MKGQSDRARFNVYRESALRGLRSQSHPRTNQFEIASDLDGLEEKFRVYNEDTLADALRERLNILDKLAIKLAPEILHLLLQLSEKPVFNSRIEDLDLLKEPEPNAGPALKWEDLIADDPSLRDKKLWRTIDYTAESSEDEDAYEVHSELSDETDATIPSSIGEERQRRPEDHAINTISQEHLQALREGQFWQKTPKVNGIVLGTVKIPITEMQSIREVLFMLGGVSTSLFESHVDRPLFVNFSKKYTMTHISFDLFSKLMDAFAEQGSRLERLRSWIKRIEPIPLLQILQSSIQERLASFELLLSAIQTRFLALEEDVTVSLLGLRNELSSSIQPLLRISEVIERLVSERYGHAFRYLEMLFDETCVSQMAGDTEMYEFMGRIFFQCFRVYLRPIRTWMEEGELTPGDKVFFVAEAFGHNETTSLWKSRFKIRRTQDGVLHAPRFLSTATNKIFTAGKSVVVLKHLNQFELFKAGATTVEPILDFGTVCNPDTLGIAPFPESFDTAFDEWIQSKQHHASYLLRRTLFGTCGLRISLEALSQLYFLSDGIITSAFTNSVFDKLDTLNSSWNDRFTLTELVQSTFGTLPAISADRIQINVLSLSPKQRDVATCRRTVKALAIIELRYGLSWPIQIVLSALTLSSYRRVFTFLLHIRRSSHILSRRRLVTDDQSDISSSDERALYYSLRARLLWFNDMLYYYLTTLVLEPRSQKMREDLSDAKVTESAVASEDTDFICEFKLSGRDIDTNGPRTELRKPS